MSENFTEIRVIPVAAFADNYLWLVVRNGQAIVIDPGDAAAIETALQSLGATLAAILVTHHHRDHVGGIAALTQRYAVPVHGPAAEPIEGITVPHEGGEAIEYLGLAFTVLSVPGHTAGHLAYYAPGPDWLFCGDTLFAAGCGRLLGGTAPALHTSLMRLAALPPQTRVYCAHEYTLANLRFARAVEPHNPALIAREQRCMAQRQRGEPTVPTTLAEELATNPFLRCHEPTVQAAVQAHQPGIRTTSLATFTALRAWKDGFR